MSEIGTSPEKVTQSDASPGVTSAKSQKSANSRGGNFFALDRDTWERLWTFKPTNRLHFVTAYLVLLAGTGADHQFTKWSAKAIETYVGIGKPRGQKAIEELDECGFITHAEGSTRKRPHYRLKPLDPEADPIYLPVALITGLSDETPILRRIRETGDPYILRMLVDLYGMVEGDVTHAPPIARARLIPSRREPTRKLFEIGVHTVWRMDLGWERRANGDWVVFHRPETLAKSQWQDEVFWQRLYKLEAMRAFTWADWVFDGPDTDAEPLFPVRDAAILDKETHGSTVGMLAGFASEYLTEARYPYRQYDIDDDDVDDEEEDEDKDLSTAFVRVPLPSHHRRPVVRAVLSLTIEADTPRRRIALGQRMARVKAYSEAFERIREDASLGVVHKPLRLVSTPLSG